MKLALSPDLKLPQDAVTETFGILGLRNAGVIVAAGGKRRTRSGRHAIVYIVKALG